MSFLRSSLILLVLIGYFFLPYMSHYWTHSWYFPYGVWGLLILATGLLIQPLRGEHDV